MKRNVRKFSALSGNVNKRLLWIHSAEEIEMANDTQRLKNFSSQRFHPCEGDLEIRMMNQR